MLNVNRFYGLNKKLEQDPQKLEDALKVMRVLSTVAGTSALQPATALKSSLLETNLRKFAQAHLNSDGLPN